MRIAYLILAHKNPSQLVELVTALDDPIKTRFYIHINQLSADFLDSPSLKPIMNRENVLFLRERVRVHWGGFSLVEAMLRLLRKAVDEGGFQYAVLLSGQDFPITSNRRIETFFEEHEGKEFIGYTPLPPKKEEWGPHIMERIEYYWRADDVLHLLEMSGSEGLREWGWSAYCNLTRLAYRCAPGLKIKFLPGIVPYGGSSWFTISFRCAKHILNYLQDHPEYCKFFSHTVIADECFFQTLILNSPIRDYVVNDTLRFIDWDPGSLHPRVLTDDDYDRIVTSGRLYARKFDSTKYPDIISKIKGHISECQ